MSRVTAWKSTCWTATLTLWTLAFTATLSSAAVADRPAWRDQPAADWHGFEQFPLTIDGCEAWVVAPKEPLPGNPWVWCMEFPGAFVDRIGGPDLLQRGFHYVHIKVGNTFGCPAALKHFDAFYDYLTANGLAGKGTLIGISRGGLYAYNWAAQNPEKVLAIYGDAPVCDFKSWPGGKGDGQGSPPNWQALIKHYQFADEAEALAWRQNPVDQLSVLAKAKIPLIHVVGDEDQVVPVSENTAIVEQRYKALGGEIRVIRKPGVGHHPHGLEDPTPVVEWIAQRTDLAASD